jgi:hypothetical protein
VLEAQALMVGAFGLTEPTNGYAATATRLDPTIAWKRFR